VALAYDFDVQFVRRRHATESADTLDWVLPPAQTGFSACLWLQTQTDGTILSLGGPHRVMTSHKVLSQDDRYDIVMTVDRRPVEAERCANCPQFFNDAVVL